MPEAVEVSPDFTDMWANSIPYFSFLRSSILFFSFPFLSFSIFFLFLKSVLIFFSGNPKIPPGFPDGSSVKNPPAVWETWVQSLGWEDPLEKEMATHSSILAWEIPRTEEPGGLQSMGLQRVGHDLVIKPPPLETKIWVLAVEVSKDANYL